MSGNLWVHSVVLSSWPPVHNTSWHTKQTDIQSSLVFSCLSDSVYTLTKISYICDTGFKLIFTSVFFCLPYPAVTTRTCHNHMMQYTHSLTWIWYQIHRQTQSYNVIWSSRHLYFILSFCISSIRILSFFISIFPNLIFLCFICSYLRFFICSYLICSYFNLILKISSSSVGVSLTNSTNSLKAEMSFEFPRSAPQTRTQQSAY